eukprot:scaffold35661_cov20-Tisochrysis_lutea.AAC.2
MHPFFSIPPSQPGAHHGVNNVRILNSKNIARMLSDEPPSQPYDPHLPAINLEKCKLREKKALEQAAQQAKRVNSGVTTEAQCIFEALNKTLPCEWQDKTIVVLPTCIIVGHACAGIKSEKDAGLTGIRPLYSCLQALCKMHKQKAQLSSTFLEAGAFKCSP